MEESNSEPREILTHLNWQYFPHAPIFMILREILKITSPHVIFRYGSHVALMLNSFYKGTTRKNFKIFCCELSSGCLMLDIATLIVSLFGIFFGVAYLNLIEKWHSTKKSCRETQKP